MKKKQKNAIKRSAAGKQLTYWWLYKAAKYHLSIANSRAYGRLCNCMSGLLMTAFMLEAFFNHILFCHCSLDEAKANERLSSQDKLKKIFKPINQENLHKQS